MATRTEIEFGSAFLDDVVGWIRDNLEPGDVFSNKVLETWAEKWAQEQQQWISDPDDWALSNGYIKE